MAIKNVEIVLLSFKDREINPHIIINNRRFLNDSDESPFFSKKIDNEENNIRTDEKIKKCSLNKITSRLYKY